jgi:hypothetical protein
MSLRSFRIFRPPRRHESAKQVVGASMPLFYSSSPCAICAKPIGSNRDDIIGFDFIEIAEPDFQRFADCFAHVSCLSAWQRRDEFIATWNEALSEYYQGKKLFINEDGRVRYTEPGTWRIEHSPAVQRRNEEACSVHQADLANRRRDLDRRMKEARQKAINLGLAGASDVDQVIRGLPIEDFQKYFGEFRVSRAFFRD